MTTHPNLIDLKEKDSPSQLSESADEDTEPPEGYEFKDVKPIMVLRKSKPFDLVLNQEVKINVAIEELQKIFPEFLLDIDNLGLIRSNYDLISNLDLTVRYTKLIILDQTFSFDESLANDPIACLRFRDYVLYMKGYLEHDGNYFEKETPIKTRDMSIYCLRNLRVTLFWSNIYLDEFQQKRIITLGLALLKEDIYEAEFLFQVNEIIRGKGKFDVYLTYIPKRFVRLGIQAPLFTF